MRLLPAPALLLFTLLAGPALAADPAPAAKEAERLPPLAAESTLGGEPVELPVLWFGEVTVEAEKAAQLPPARCIRTVEEAKAVSRLLGRNLVPWCQDANGQRVPTVVFIEQHDPADPNPHFYRFYRAPGKEGAVGVQNYAVVSDFKPSGKMTLALLVVAQERVQWVYRQGSSRQITPDVIEPNSGVREVGQWWFPAAGGEPEYDTARRRGAWR